MFAVGGAGGTGGWRDSSFFSWRREGYEGRRRRFGRAVLAGTVAVILAWMAVEEITEHNVLNRGDTVVITGIGPEHKLDLNKPKEKIKKKLEEPTQTTTGTPGEGTSTTNNSSNGNKTTGSENSSNQNNKDNGNESNEYKESPAQERAEERAERRNRLNNSRQHGHERRNRAFSRAARTLSLRRGGNIWNSVKGYEVRYGLPHTNPAIDSVTDSVVEHKGLSEPETRQLPVGYTFTIPASALEQFR